MYAQQIDDILSLIGIALAGIGIISLCVLACLYSLALRSIDARTERARIAAELSAEQREKPKPEPARTGGVRSW